MRTLLGEIVTSPHLLTRPCLLHRALNGLLLPNRRFSISIGPAMMNLSRLSSGWVYKMTGNMVCVGDICGAAAARRVLREGARILSGVEQQHSTEEHDGVSDRSIGEIQVTWGLSKTFKGYLERLASIIEEQEQEQDH